MQWAEDDFDVPTGVIKLQALSAPGFRPSPDGMLGRGVYLSRALLKASRYPIGHPEHDKVVIKVVVNVGRVIAINHQYHPQRKTWHDHGFDTAWVPPNSGMVKSGLEEDCVWDPSRITISKIINPTPLYGRVIAIRKKDHPRQKTWHDHGFDTAWVPPNCGMVKSGLEEDCVWDPSRITISKIIDPKPVPTGARGYM
ncbi:hypothetical protein KUCAC02_007189 [Chaenocephalus aceratus]|uniref:Uncharacterized protein n=1 Tax=Chaenocephalus aceratus TaxID=36190 RepID=A0ACB9X613_CHAAC|nr:hypothetical protein KUCAC02_007189 [Chaenocephalus aceratus]